VTNPANGEANTVTKLANIINTNKIDIIVLCYNYDNFLSDRTTDADGVIRVLSDFVINKKGVLIIGGEYNLNHVKQLMKNVYGTVVEPTFSGNVTNRPTNTFLNIDDIVIKGSTTYGSFGNIAGLGFGVDARNANWITYLPPSYANNSVILNTIPTGTFAGNIGLLRHSTLGFIYIGDSGFTTNGVMNVTATGTINTAAAYHNAEMMGNIFVWAIQKVNSSDYNPNYQVDDNFNY
jgi:hypothetical protein